MNVRRFQRAVVQFQSCAGFLGRLRSDVRGNTLGIIAASLIPLTAMIGCGLDMSRGYLGQNRLQQACDAAALAGRRVMTGGTADATVVAEATKFFNFNFPQRKYQTAAFTPSVSATGGNTVVVSASTTMPTAIMKIFGYRTMALSATCNARQDYVNTDIVLVLDTTGSMNDDVNGNAVNGGSTSKIVGLRNAVMALYDQLAPVQTQLTNAGLRLRYSIVPYSSTVNAGSAIRTTNTAYLRDSSNYQTRVANFTQAVYVPAGAPTVTNETYGSTTTGARCLNYGYNQSFTGFTPNPAGEPIASGTLTYYQPYSYNGSTTDFTGTSNKTCIRKKTVYPTYATRYAFTGFGYQQDAVDTSRFKTGASTTVAIEDANNVMGGTVATSGSYDGVYVAANATTPFAIPTSTTSGVLTVPARVASTSTTVQTTPSTTSFTWSGCIEERQTVNTINSSSSLAIPNAAYDLNIDYVPDSDATRWSPHWPDMIWYHNVGSYTSSAYDNNNITDVRTPSQGYYACPTAATTLTTMSRSDMLSYVNSLTPLGGTYHDIGMIWGARMLSSTGLFSSYNPTTYNSMPVAKYIIFLTDGMMAPNPDSYSAYGVEYMDQRVTGSASASGQHDDHVQRFEMICNSAKSEGVSIWVIAFASALDTSLTSCASNANQASTSASQQDLLNRFAYIGSQIGALRITQ